jgi:hypothetical protein
LAVDDHRDPTDVVRAEERDAFVTRDLDERRLRLRAGERHGRTRGVDHVAILGTSGRTRK